MTERTTTVTYRWKKLFKIATMRKKKFFLFVYGSLGIIIFKKYFLTSTSGLPFTLNSLIRLYTQYHFLSAALPSYLPPVSLDGSYKLLSIIKSVIYSYVCFQKENSLLRLSLCRYGYAKCNWNKFPW